VFHTAHERDAFGVRGECNEIVPHGLRFRPYSRAARDDARRALAIERDATIFLCIGFIGEHKGFDRAVRAFAGAGRNDALLYIVGSVLYSTPESDRYIQGLRNVIAEAEGAALVERFVDDAEFDLWIQAADLVLLPYREASSSGVLARAALFGTPVVVSAAGGLVDQLDGVGVVADSDEELTKAIEGFVRSA
jgi:glycosyltransferase involved in cell wall biosynthesis